MKETTQLKKLMEAVRDWAQPTSYETEDDSGNHYLLTFQDDGGDEVGYLEKNGITIAYFKVGGAGPMQSTIKDADAVMDALVTFLTSAGR